MSMWTELPRTEPTGPSRGEPTESLYNQQSQSPRKALRIELIPQSMHYKNARAASLKMYGAFSVAYV